MTKALSDVLKFSTCTDPGMVRSNNEDAVFVNPGLGLAILADGMGGSNSGEVASAMATTLLANDLKEALASLSPADVGENGEARALGVLQDKIAVANGSIYRAADSQPQYSGMGTTLVVALFYDDRVAVAHIGDSRLYRLRAGTLEQLTRDHSLVQLQIDSGMLSPEEARRSTHKNVVLRALGVGSEVEPEIHEHRVLPGDIYLLCSDGLHDMVEGKEMTGALRAAGADLQPAAAELVRMANEHGGRDNISVILVRVLESFATPRGRWRRLRAWLR